MALASVQHALARLFTEDELRAHYFADPAGVGHALGLDDAEVLLLAGLAPCHVEQFAETLKRKRTADVRNRLPLTARALGPGFPEHARRALVAPLSSGRRHRDDARALVEQLAELGSLQGLEQPWITDLARYEMTCVDVLRDRPILVVRWFRYPVGRLVTVIDSGVPVGEVRPRWTLAGWLRAPGSRMILHRIWS